MAEANPTFSASTVPGSTIGVPLYGVDCEESSVKRIQLKLPTAPESPTLSITSLMT